MMSLYSAPVMAHLKLLAAALRPRMDREYTRFVWIVNGKAIATNGEWLAGFLNPELIKDAALNKDLTVAENVVPSAPAIDAVLPKPLVAGWEIDARKLFNLCAAIAPSVDRVRLGVTISIDWDSGGIPVLCCDASASDISFDPANLRTALACFPADLAQTARAFYNEKRKALVVTSSCGKHFAILPRLVPTAV